MPPVASIIADCTAHMQAAATLAPTSSLWRSIALSLVPLLCLLLYLRRRRNPQAAPYHNEQPARVFEKRGNSAYLNPAPHPQDYPASIAIPLSTPSFCFPSSLGPTAAAPPPLPLPTLRRHSCHVAQQARQPTILHYERRISMNDIGTPKSIRGSIMRGGPLGSGVRRNQWTIKIG
ncbi:hypothetical protein B0J12DRAFT_253306 [Macrophomina phaseolina]|uniref:Uncharacterized protein n=1 Tax=Macrophomina phaseolina TaxID=35725 RepID=A0ABQ8FZX5_9PEZI|nr:hypothetical protein B0J12DRAFT_253306 [Macrophomina phaseolina]